MPHVLIDLDHALLAQIDRDVLRSKTARDELRVQSLLHAKPDRPRRSDRPKLRQPSFTAWVNALARDPTVTVTDDEIVRKDPNAPLGIGTRESKAKAYKAMIIATTKDHAAALAAYEAKVKAYRTQLEAYHRERLAQKNGRPPRVSRYSIVKELIKLGAAQYFAKPTPSPPKKKPPAKRIAAELRP